MPTVRVEIKDSHIAEAIEKAKAGMPTGEVLVYSDAKLSGLQLRVQGKQAFWTLKYFNWTKTLGYAHPTENNHLPSISAARKLAGSAKDVLDDDPEMFKPLIAKYYGAADRDVKKARKEMVAGSTGWTLLEAAEFMISERTKENSDSPIRPNYVSQIRLTLRRKSLKDLVKMRVADIAKGHCDKAKRDLLENEGVSAMKKFVSDIRSILSYCAEHATDMTGLDYRNMWWELLKSGKKAKAKTRKPSLDDIVRTLILAEEYTQKPLPGRIDSKRGLRQNVFNVLWWYCLTAQRATAGVRLRFVDFFEDPKRPNSGWHLAFWSEGDMKNSNAFVLPIPPRASAFMINLLKSAAHYGATDWCFPSDRKGKNGDQVPVDRSSAGGVVERLGARDYQTRSNPTLAHNAVDLLAANGINYWSPHDLRRSLTEAMEDEGIPGGASAVLAHEVKLSDELIFRMSDKEREDALALRVSRITKIAYGAGQFIPLKSRAMEKWTNLILDRYEELHPAHRQERKIKHSERVLKAIWNDASSAEQARETALKELPNIRKRLESTLADHRETLAHFMRKSPSSYADIRIANVQIEIAKGDLEALNADPDSYLLEPSREPVARGLWYVLAQNSGLEPVDLVQEAPAYSELRDQYISGKVGYSTFVSMVEERYPITLQISDDKIIIGPVTGDEIL